MKLAECVTAVLLTERRPDSVNRKHVQRQTPRIVLSRTCRVGKVREALHSLDQSQLAALKAIHGLVLYERAEL